MRSLLRDENGQALIEYMLMLSLVVGFATTMAVGFRKIMLSLWGAFTRDVSAACPGCPPDPRYRFK